MIAPLTGEVVQTPEATGRFAGFLRELASGLPAHRVHAIIAEQCDLPGHDRRMDGALADVDEFAAVWSGLLAGTRLPAGAWEPVVLPAVIALSNRTNLKAHLELATSLWVAARQVAQRLPIAAAVEPAPDPAPAQPLRESTPTTPAPEVGPRRRGRVWLMVAIAVLAVLAAAAYVWWRAHEPASPALSTLDDQAQAQYEPTIVPPSLLPQAVPTVPTPSPTWSGPGPKVPPGAPTELRVIAVDSTKISLAWQAPGNPGSGGIAYYRITINGADGGWTGQTSVTLTGLTPASDYTFTVMARNHAGLFSPASTAVTATTASPPSPTPSPSSSESPPPSSASPTPSP